MHDAVAHLWPLLLTVTIREPGVPVSRPSSSPVRAKWPRWLVPSVRSKPSSVSSRGMAITPALLISRSRLGQATRISLGGRADRGQGREVQVDDSHARALGRGGSGRQPVRPCPCHGLPARPGPAPGQLPAVSSPRPALPPVSTAIRPAGRGHRRPSTARADPPSPSSERHLSVYQILIPTKIQLASPRQPAPPAPAPTAPAPTRLAPAPTRLAPAPTGGLPTLPGVPHLPVRAPRPLAVRKSPAATGQITETVRVQVAGAPGTRVGGMGQSGRPGEGDGRDQPDRRNQHLCAADRRQHRGDPCCGEPKDAEAVREMHATMSPDNIYLRFFSLSPGAPRRPRQRGSPASRAPTTWRCWRGSAKGWWEWRATRRPSGAGRRGDRVRRARRHAPARHRHPAAGAPGVAGPAAWSRCLHRVDADGGTRPCSRVFAATACRCGASSPTA